MFPTSESGVALILPLPLLLLVHLYILQYPHANDAEYDHDLFNPQVRGLRDRTRTMEDIAYFLVSRIEGKGIKTILSTYPCRQPSESLSFRTSLTKYLEQIRHQVIYPTRSNGDASSATEKLTASWWKDVVVRKSLLEACAGDKFERLILSLSTHVLMKALFPIPFETLSTRLRSQPLLYSAAVARYNSIRHAWTRSASLLLKWENDLKLLCVRLQSHPQNHSTKYALLPMSRLKALAQSKLEGLTNLHWTGDEARSALSALIGLSGLRLLTSDADKRVMPPSQTLTDNDLPIILSPLPVAAAHHPSYLKKLKRPVFQSLKSNAITTPLPTKSHAEIILAVQIDAAKHVQQLLVDAISRLKKRQSALRHAVGSMSSRMESEGATSFWSFPPNNFEIFYNPEPDIDLFLVTGLEKDFAILHPDTEGSNLLEKRIDELRLRVLAPYPVPPDPAAPRLPPQELTPASRIPQLKPMTAPRKDIAVLASDRLTVPPRKSPASARRKSVRFSTARNRTGRPSMFCVFSNVEDDVDLLVDQTHDFPTDDDDTDRECPVVHKTPKAKRKTPKVNRIWTAGTPKMKAMPRPRASDYNAIARLFDAELVLELPTLGFSTSSLFSEDSSRSEDAGEIVDADATLMPERHPPTVYSSASTEEVGSNGSQHGLDDDDFFVDDPPSMTLKELLLSADSGQSDLLAEDDKEEDGSFAWE